MKMISLSLQICNPPLGPQPWRDMGRKGNVCLLYGFCHGAHSLVPGPHASYSHVGKFPQKELSFSESGTQVSTWANGWATWGQYKMDIAVPLPVFATRCKEVSWNSCGGAQLRRSLLNLLGNLGNSADQVK